MARRTLLVPILIFSSAHLFAPHAQDMTVLHILTTDCLPGQYVVTICVNNDPAKGGGSGIITCLFVDTKRSGNAQGREAFVLHISAEDYPRLIMESCRAVDAQRSAEGVSDGTPRV
ncbi:hypothetical protein DFH05DRAFT_1455077 [Lentinula detonsa]|uniref:Uncharacterized protein n=1 Tax=Lentinula detonsa TaxID=2804962 RepID=A0A9W8U264_9AGAR|nr:hypothetical protein DFH05DRAFT_1455077 [Lentinula detonsa]